MYLFVRITAIILMVIGILIMLAGVVYAVIAVANLFGNAPGLGPVVPGVGPLLVAPYGGVVVSLLIFFQGLLITAAGQLMLVFTDIANNTAESVALLRGSVITEE